MFLRHFIYVCHLKLIHSLESPIIFGTQQPYFPILLKFEFEQNKDDEGDDDNSNKYSSNNQDDKDDRGFVASTFENEEIHSVVVQNRTTKRPLGKQKKNQEEKCE